MFRFLHRHRFLTAAVDGALLFLVFVALTKLL